MRKPTDAQIKAAMEQSTEEQTVFTYRENDMYCATLLIRRKRGRALVKGYYALTIRDLRAKLKAVSAYPSKRWTRQDFKERY